MRYCKTFITICVLAVVTGCSSSRILITSNKYHFPLEHSKIMVVGAIGDDNDSIRANIEKYITRDLEKLGYNTISAVEKFGAKGLANLGQSETYLKLCNEGIDAVIVITLIDMAKEDQFKTSKSHIYPDNYYYDRIWNYKNIRADLSNSDSVPSNYFWEAILFNLRTLEAECTIQSRSFPSRSDSKAADFEKQLVKKMVKEKILKKQNNKPKRPF